MDPTTHNPAHARAVGQLLLAALMWSLGGLLVKWIDWPPLAIAGGRALIAAAVLVILQKGLRLNGSATQVGAAVAYALCTLCFVVATKLTTAANAILLQYTAPIWVALLGASLLGERATRGDWIAIGVAFVGMGLFFAQSLQAGGMVGNLVAILAGVSFAVTALLLRKQKDGSATESIILGNLFAGVVGLPFLLDAPTLSGAGWAALLVLGVVQLGLSYALYARAIRHVSALQAVLIPVLEPILNPVWVMLFLGERPGLLAACGGALVLASVAWRAVHAIRINGKAAAGAPAQRI